MADTSERATKTEVVFLRLPTDVIARVTRCAGQIQMQEGVSLNKTQAFCRILTAGCAALERTRESSEPPVPAQIPQHNGVAQVVDTAQPAIPLALEPAPTTAHPVAVPQASGTTRATPAPRGAMRQRILGLLGEHPDGLRADEMRVYLGVEKPIGDTLQGMRKSGVVRTQGHGREMRYFFDQEPLGQAVQR